MTIAIGFESSVRIFHLHPQPKTLFLRRTGEFPFADIPKRLKLKDLQPGKRRSIMGLLGIPLDM
jgi:hypothetical protein